MIFSSFCHCTRCPQWPKMTYPVHRLHPLSSSVNHRLWQTLPFHKAFFMPQKTRKKKKRKRKEKKKKKESAPPTALIAHLLTSELPGGLLVENSFFNVFIWGGLPPAVNEGHVSWHPITPMPVTFLVPLCCPLVEEEPTCGSAAATGNWIPAPPRWSTCCNEAHYEARFKAPLKPEEK